MSKVRSKIIAGDRQQYLSDGDPIALGDAYGVNPAVLFGDQKAGVAASIDAARRRHAIFRQWRRGCIGTRASGGDQEQRRGERPQYACGSINCGRWHRQGFL